VPFEHRCTDYIVWFHRLDPFKTAKQPENVLASWQFLSAKLLYGFLWFFFLFVTVIVAKLKLKSANLKIK